MLPACLPALACLHVHGAPAAFHPHEFPPTLLYAPPPPPPPPSSLIEDWQNSVSQGFGNRVWPWDMSNGNPVNCSM